MSTRDGVRFLVVNGRELWYTILMKRWTILCCLFLLLIGCAGRGETGGEIPYIPAETASAYAGPAGLVTAAPVATAAPLFTLGPTAAPTPVPTPTPIPTPTP